MAIRLMTWRKESAFVAPGMYFGVWSGPFEPSIAYRADFVEILIVESGEGRRVIHSPSGITTVSLLPGQILILRPTDIVEIRSAGHSEMSAIGVAFPMDTWERFAELADVDPSLFRTRDSPVVDVSADVDAALADFRGLLAKYRAAPALIDLVAFLTAVIPRFSTPDGRGDDLAPEWLWDAIASMRDEANLRLGVSRLVELGHVSPAHLWRSTVRFFGQSPTTLVSELRLNHAIHLLRTSGDSMATIGERCGYADASHFSNVFRRQMDMTPRQFRALVKRSASPVDDSPSHTTRDRGPRVGTDRI